MRIQSLQKQPDSIRIPDIYQIQIMNPNYI